MKFRVEIMPTASRDVAEIYNWMHEHSPEGADRWMSAFQHCVERLEYNPEFYGLAAEDEIAEDEIREFLFKTPKGRVFRGIFSILGDHVSVLHVRSSDRGPLAGDELR